MKVIFKANNENFEIDLTYEQIEFLKNFSVKRFRAKKNKNYYYIDSDLSIKSSFDKTQKEDLNRFKIGNYFESEKEAAYSIEKILLNQSYLDYIKSKSSVVDWYNQNQKKYYAYYNFNKNEILIGETKVTKRQ